jgi:hypothetical protein
MLQDEPFLRESYYCDYSHPAVRELADAFRAKHPDDRELAVGLFYHVRDSIKYEVGNWQQTAAQTVERGSGTCTNSANLLVALLRACGIPAGYGVMSVRGREYFGPIAPRRLARFAAEVSKHVYGYAWLGGAWLRCDPSDDEELSLATRHLNPPSEPVDWDGLGDAILNLHPDHILEDRGPIADIDGFMGKPMRLALRVPVSIGNRYLEFLREKGAQFQHPDEAEPAFERWLRSRNPIHYRLYRAIPTAGGVSQIEQQSTAP